MQGVYLAALCLALFGPLLIAVTTTTVARRGAPNLANVGARVLLAAITAAAIFLCLGRLQMPLAGIGLSPPTWRTPLLALALAASFIWFIGPCLMKGLHWLGARDFEHGPADLRQIPLASLVVAIMVVATLEEMLYRGIGYNLLREWAHPATALIVASIAFAIAHIPHWGIAPSMAFGLLGGGVFTAFYAATGDLWANTLAHIAVDMVGIVLPFRHRG